MWALLARIVKTRGNHRLKSAFNMSYFRADHKFLHASIVNLVCLGRK